MVAGLSKKELEEKSRAILERYNKSVMWWNDHLPELTARYPGQCVAVYDAQIVGVSPDYQELFGEVKAKGYPLRETVREYVHPERITPLNMLRMDEPSEEEKACMARYSKDVRWFSAHRDELRKQYMGCWVAVHYEQIVGTGPNLEDLLSEMRAKAYPLGEIAYELIKADHTPRYWVFTPFS